MVQQGPSPTNTAGPPGRNRISGGLVAGLVGGGLLGVFMAQNTQSVTLQFLFWSFSWPL